MGVAGVDTERSSPAVEVSSGAAEDSFPAAGEVVRDWATDTDDERSDGASAAPEGVMADDVKADGVIAGGVLADGVKAGDATADGVKADGVMADGATADGAVAGGVPTDGVTADDATADDATADGVKADDVVADAVKADDDGPSFGAATEAVDDREAGAWAVESGVATEARAGLDTAPWANDAEPAAACIAAARSLGDTRVEASAAGDRGEWSGCISGAADTSIALAVVEGSGAAPARSGGAAVPTEIVVAVAAGGPSRDPAEAIRGVDSGAVGEAWVRRNLDAWLSTSRGGLRSSLVTNVSCSSRVVRGRVSTSAGFESST